MSKSTIYQTLLLLAAVSSSAQSCTKRLTAPTEVSSIDSYAVTDANKLTVTAVKGNNSSWFPTAIASNLLDGNLATYFSTEESTQGVIFTLDTARTVSYIKLAPYGAVLYRFDVYTSLDSVTWTKLTSDSIKGTGLHAIELPDTIARYVRIIGKGNNGAYPKANSWTEAEIYGTAIAAPAPVPAGDDLFFLPNDPNIVYTGRIDFSNPLAPRAWQPGVYMQTVFTGTSCRVIIGDEKRTGAHNFVTIAVDGGTPKRILLSQKSDTLLAVGSNSGDHTLTVCREVDGQSGYITFGGIISAGGIKAPSIPNRRIEFIGDSQTSGAGIDGTLFPCGSIGLTYDQHDAYRAYGPIAARSLNARWMLSSVSGDGLVKSYGKQYTIPTVYDKIDMWNNQLTWNFDNYTPDVVTICLGQNDFKQGADTETFRKAYITFLGTVRGKYPSAQIICLNSPMNTWTERIAQSAILKQVTETVRANGDLRVTYHIFNSSYWSGCGGHPNMVEQQTLGAEVASTIKTLMNW